MGATILSHADISVQRSFFGMRQSAVYQPTQSAVKAERYEFSPEAGAKVEKLLKCTPEQLEQERRSGTKIEKTQLGNVLLEACVSDDKQFAALQLFRYGNLKYNPVTDVQIYEGDNAALISSFFQ